MRCQKCGQEKASVSLPYLGLRLCRRCFCTLIIRRVKKEIRAGQLINPRERILLIDDGTKEAPISKSILTDSYHGHLTVAVIQRKRFSIDTLPSQLAKTIAAKRISTVVLPWNLDDEVTHFLEHLITDHDFSTVGHFTGTFHGQKRGVRYVKLLRKVLESECRLFATCRGIRGTTRKPATKLQRDIRAMLDAIEATHPETKFSLLKSIDGMQHMRLL